MWRKKTGFNDYLAIVKRMDFLTRGRTYRSYYVWNVVTKRYDYTYNRDVEQVNEETLDKFIISLTGYPELDRIQALTAWVRQRNGNATREFRHTRTLYEYEKRLREYEAS